jgi:hypothetical protein
MRKLFFILPLLLPSMAFASSGGVQLIQANNDITDKASLQAGAKLFVNYCMGCHSAQYVRFSRVAQDLGLEEEELTENLMFTAEKVGETMTIAMDKDEAKKMVRSHATGFECDCSCPWCRLVIYLPVEFLRRSVASMGGQQLGLQGRWDATCFVGTARMAKAILRNGYR